MSADKAIHAAMERLKTARLGLEDMKRGGERFNPGFMNAVVFGRMVTFALQNMKSTVPDFEEWYLVKRQEMIADPLMRYFHELRTEIEKRVDGHLSMEGSFSLDFNDISDFGPPPPGAYGMFMGDMTGGSGWLIMGENGEEQKYYVALPKHMADFQMRLERAPGDYKDKAATDLLDIYLNRLSGLVDEAKEKFLI